MHGFNAEGFAMDYELKRSISDIQSKIASLDFSVMAASRRAASPSPRDLITRVATCYLLGRQKTKANVALRVA